MKRRDLLLAAPSAILLAACERRSGPPVSAYHGVDITGADYGRDLSLPDADGRTRTLADFAGKVTVVFFGYTQCPDVCPTTMAELAQLKRSLGPEGDKLQAVFVTVDPERDRPELLKAYVSGFDPAFVALRGTAEQTAVTAKSFKVFYAKVPAKDGGSGYTMDHTAGSYVFDARGRLRLFERYGTKPEDLRADLKRLLDGA